MGVRRSSTTASRVRPRTTPETPLKGVGPAAALEKIPTWPWPRGMFRNLMAAFLLPVFIWLIQFVLQKMLG